MTMLVSGLAAGERALVRADHMPPLPLEHMVMLECECWVVRVKSGKLDCDQCGEHAVYLVNQ